MDEMKKGGISVEIEHIFPIIKKWLYSEKEIFLRELVSNACDAVTKLNRLSSLGEVRDLVDTFRIDVTVDKLEKTLTVSDNGIGMSEEEVEKYICQIALSGAMDFIQKYEGENGASGGIIGHFGLGFYSAFMVADRVEVDTKSYTDAPAVHWSCEENGSYEMQASDRTARGTDVILHVTEEEAEYLDMAKIRGILEKYCSFMPIEIYLHDANAEEEPCECEHEHADGEECECEHEHADGEECKCEHEHAPKPVNDTHPLWQKPASECTEEEYRDFYQKVFHDYKEPLFHVHLSADYPLNFKGILYFPRINLNLDPTEGQVHLYYNQVFVADNIKEVIPEYLLMLRGVLDCPELPLNVSRSYLQNSGYVSKISSHITKKVADKLNSMFQNDRKKYEEQWKDLSVFVEYGAMRERKFYDRIKDSILFETTNTGDERRFVTLPEYLENAEKTNEKTVYYTTDPKAQAQYISMFEAQGIEVVVFRRVFDTQFVSVIEQNEPGVKFVRIDADVARALCEEGDADTEIPEVTELFREISGNKDLRVSFRRLKDARVPALVNLSEESRRMADMMEMYGMSADGMPSDASLVVNLASPLTEKLKTADGDTARRVAKQIWALANLAQRQLTAEELQNFLLDSFRILETL